MKLAIVSSMNLVMNLHIWCADVYYSLCIMTQYTCTVIIKVVFSYF